MFGTVPTRTEKRLKCWNIVDTPMSGTAITAPTCMECNHPKHWLNNLEKIEFQVWVDLGLQWGSNGGKWEKYVGRCVGFLLFFIIVYGIFGVLIIPKWLINDSGWILILFG